MVVASRLVAAGLAAGIAGLTFVAWRARRAGPAAQAAKQHCRTLVASKTAAKLSAVEAALSPCTVLGCSTESFVSNQPVGVEEIMRGAANRIRQLVDSDQAEQFNCKLLSLPALHTVRGQLKPTPCALISRRRRRRNRERHRPLRTGR